MLLVPGPHSENHCFLEPMPILHFCIFVRSDYVSIYNQTIATDLDFPGFFATASSHATNKNLQNRDSRKFYSAYTCLLATCPSSLTLLAWKEYSHQTMEQPSYDHGSGSHFGEGHRNTYKSWVL